MPYTFSREAYERRISWYTRARFGMFIHWGLYAIPARGEWVRSVERIPSEAYDPYREEFNPGHCDMGAWMDAAKKFIEGFFLRRLFVFIPVYIGQAPEECVISKVLCHL